MDSINIGALKRSGLPTLRRRFQQTEERVDDCFDILETARSRHFAAQVDREIVRKQMWNKGENICEPCVKRFLAKPTNPSIVYQEGKCDFCGLKGEVTSKENFQRICLP